MQNLFLILAVVLITGLALKGVPIFFAAAITSLFILVTQGMPVVPGMTETFAQAFGGFISKNFFIFVLGAIFGKILELSRATDSIANFVVGKLGEKAVIPAIIIAGGIMGYGGISVFVGLFSLYPLMFSLFERANITRTLAPAIYCAAAGSFTVWMPGAPSIQLLMPVTAFGTSTFAAAAPGLIVAFIQIILEILLCQYFVKKTQAKGLGWEGWEEAGAAAHGKEDSNYPPFLLALLPMIILIVSLGVLKINPPVALTIGIVAGLILYAKYLPWKDNFWKHLQTAFAGGSGALMATCSAVGFGAVIQSTPAFQNLINIVVGMEGNPVIISVAITAILAGICGSGTGGEAMSLPIIQEYFVPMGANVEALTSGVALSTMIFTLPNNSVVNTAITAANTTHKKAYPYMFATIAAMSFVSMILLLIAFKIFGYM